jgi:UDP-N-acetylglucosamine acyltransferase
VKAAREPISYVGVNTIGLKRRGFNENEIRNIEDVYRIIFVQNQNVSKGMEQVEIELKESPQKKEILEFIKSSPKGVMKGIY